MPRPAPTSEAEPQTGTVTGTSGPRTKRRRVHLACVRCRDRKIRCDGGWPACSSCSRRQQEALCKYDQAATSSTRHIAALEDRIHRLENVGPRDSATHPTTTVRNSSPPTAVAASPDRTSPWHGGNTRSHSSEEVTIPSLQPERHGLGGQVDALATVMSPEDDDASLYGGSSTIAFLRQVERTDRADQDCDPPLSNRHMSDNHSTYTCGRLGRLSSLSLPRESGIAVLPIRYRADKLLACFWDFAHPLFPILHKPLFMAKYENIWLPQQSHSSGTRDIEFLCNLNLALAIGCQFSREMSAKQRLNTANQLFERSQHVLHYDILGSTSLSIVQWLLLTAVYCQSTSHASRCWNSVGLAIRIAQSLGLHMESPTSTITSQVELETNRKLWHTCVVLDRLLSMTFGRPFMIAETYNTKLPSLIDDEYLKDKGFGEQPPDVPSRLGLFVSSCKLFEILSKTLSSFYIGRGVPEQKSRGELNEMLANVVDINRRLDEFWDSTPNYLREPNNSRTGRLNGESHVNLQQQVLYCRFLYTRVLSLRPLLLMATQDSRNQVPKESKWAHSLEKDMMERCCNLCVDTAHSLIDSIYLNLDKLYRSSGWHSVYFIFASATILLAAVKIRLSGSTLNQRFEDSWNRCLRVLAYYKDSIPAAPRAIETLKNLRGRIETTQKQGTERVDGRAGITLETDSADTPTASPFLQELEASQEFTQHNTAVMDELCDTWFNQQIFEVDFMEGL